MLIAQLTDLHVTARGARAFGQVDTNDALARAVAHVAALPRRPDLVVVTGDVVNGPQPGEYAMAAELLAGLGLPLLVIPGNHDDREELRTALRPLDPGLPEGPYLHRMVDTGPLRILALDTVVPGRPEGALDAPRLAWIADRLAEAPHERPLLVLMHHPPFVSGIGHMDRMNCAGADALAGLLRGRTVAGLLCGHVHRPITAHWHGIPCFCGPGTAHLVALDLEAESPARWTREPPAVALHLWDDAHGLRTHLSFVGDFPPTRFPG